MCGIIYNKRRNSRNETVLNMLNNILYDDFISDTANGTSYSNVCELIGN